MIIMKKLHATLASTFYDKIITLHHEEFNYKYLQYKHWLDLLISKLKKRDTVLDLGCGNGRAIKYFIDRGLKGIGIDISDNMLSLAKKHVPKGTFYKKEFTAIDFKPHSIDSVISFFALNHVPKSEFKKTMALSKKILKKDGLLLLGMVKGKGEGLFGGFYNQKLQLYGSGYSKKEIIQVLNKVGFTILKVNIEHFKGKHFEEDDIYVLAKVKK